MIGKLRYLTPAIVSSMTFAANAKVCGVDSLNEITTLEVVWLSEQVWPEAHASQHVFVSAAAEVDASYRSKQTARACLRGNSADAFSMQRETKASFDSFFLGFGSGTVSFLVGRNRRLSFFGVVSLFGIVVFDWFRCRIRSRIIAVRIFADIFRFGFRRIDTENRKLLFA